jgi:valyl-tRNA synthetase
LNSEVKAKLLSELENTRNFLTQVDQKISSERFLDNAKPELVEKEQQKKTDAQTNIGSQEIFGE